VKFSANIGAGSFSELAGTGNNCSRKAPLTGKTSIPFLSDYLSCRLIADV
jgi:hypothetical protein